MAESLTEWEHLEIKMQVGERTETDWIQFEVSGKRFIGYCGPGNLRELLLMFFHIVG